MRDNEVRITVEVPRQGLRPYSFLGLGYRHNEPVPDRRFGWPTARGIPLPRGRVRDVERLVLRDATGAAVPRQVRPLAHWDDGSVMFAHVAWQCDVSHDRPAVFTLALGDESLSPGPPSPVRMREEAGQVVVDNGPLHAVVARDCRRPTLQLSVWGKPVFGGDLELWTRDASGMEYLGELDGAASVRVVEAGPLVGVVELRGQHRSADGKAFLNYELRLRFDAGRAELTLTHAFVNMGDEVEGVCVGEVGLRLPPVVGRDVLSHVVCQVSSGLNSFPRLAQLPVDVDIRIGPTGPRIGDVASLREDTTGYPPYLMHNRDLVDPYVGLRTGEWSAVTFLQEGKENWPKRLKVTGGAIEYHLWPAGSRLQNLAQGMARIHRIRLAFFEREAAALDLHRYYYQAESPVNVLVPFEWYGRCRVFGMENFLPWMPERYPLLEGTFLAEIERGWDTGMLAYGDDPKSGYNYTNIGLPDETVWINNEHDFISQAVIQTWRSGRANAWKSARVAAEHQIDVDFVRKSADRWKVGGVPAHCHRHTTAAVYPSHTWTEGLLQYYVTSGDERALEVAQSLGRNICQYVEERLEVLETESRMMGWALIALSALIEVTHDRRCLKAARTIRDDIRNVVERTGTYEAGGLNFGTGTVLTGLGNLHRVTGDRDALSLMLAIMDWHLQNGRNAMGIVWCGDLLPYKLNLTLPAYAYAYYATGDVKYVQAGIELLRFTGPPVRQTGIRTAAKQYRTYMPFLKLAHEAGVLQEIEERMR